MSPAMVLSLREFELHQSRELALQHCETMRGMWELEGALWADFQRCFPQFADAVRSETGLPASDFLWLVGSLPNDAAFRRAQAARSQKSGSWDEFERAVEGSFSWQA